MIYVVKLVLYRLWHQLTVELRKCVVDPAFVAEVDLLELYEDFIHEFQLRINALQLVEITIPVAQTIYNKSKWSFYFIVDP